MKTKFLIAVDLGASLTKCFYSCHRDGAFAVVGHKTFCSAAQRTTSTRYELRQYADDNTSLVSFEDEYWAVGLNAREAVTNINLRAPKFRNAIAKVLGLVGQIIQENVVGDGKGEIHLELGVLLPLNEMGDALELSNRLSTLLYDFGHNGNQIKCYLVLHVHVSPEGYGISRLTQRFPSGVMMFGHKDFTWSHIADTSISVADSRGLTGWGMLKLVKQISYTFVDELWAAAAICTAGEGLHDKPLLKVVPSEDLARVKSEISEARQLVWSQLWDELSTTSIQAADQVFAAGGNAVFWRPELRKALGSRLSMGGELINEIKSRFPALEKSPLLYRLADCYGLFKSLEPKQPHPSNVLVAASGGDKG
jgi:hypothetical protein